jgi:hypothetical protein
LQIPSIAGRFFIYVRVLLSHNAQLSKAFENLFVYTTQPLFLKSLFSTYLLNDLLKMLPNERNKIDLMHRIRVDEFALAYVLWCLGLCGVVRFWWPVQ